jgi:hypothetical protein
VSAGHNTPELPPVSSLDKQAARTLRHSERVTALIVVLLLLCLGALGYLFHDQAGATSRIDARVRQDVASICGFMKIIGTVQIPPAGSKILVQWVESARVAYYGHGCTPALPPPSGELRAKAAQYGVHLAR